MNYLKTLVTNFLIVFFANHVLPGILVMDQTKLPHIGGDLIMSISLGFLNTLIFPLLKMLGHAAGLKIALAALVLNFIAYAVIKLIPLGIGITSVEGYLMGSTVVAAGSFVTNFLELKRDHKKKTEIPL